MPATTRTTRPASRPEKAQLRTPRRFLHCLACGTIKKARSYALCAECYERNGRLERHWFVRLARKADREAPQYSYRVHPEFEKACRIYARRRQRAKAAAAIDRRIPRYRPPETETRSLYAHESYDGLGGYELRDLLDWQRYGTDLPELERSGERRMSDAEVARWDAEVDAWAEARGFSLADEPAPEIHPWGYWMEIDGAMVWTDDVD
jgi:hypothetical protein